MSEYEKRQELGVDYWIARCDKAEMVIENFESIVNYLLGSVENVGIPGGLTIVNQEQFAKGVSKALLEENIHANHLGIEPFKREK